MYQELWECTGANPAGVFRKRAKYLAFYADGEIKPSIAKIKSLTIEQSTSMPPMQWPGSMFIKASIRCLREEIVPMEDGAKSSPGPYKVMFLSGKDDEATITLSEAIPNDLTDRNGRRTAFTPGHRYVELESLKSARTTSEVLES